MDNIFLKNIITNNFLLLEGPSHIGKSTVVQQLAKKYLTQFIRTDYRYLADLSDYLGKNHSIKIEVDAKDKNMEIENYGKYTDYGIREIIDWTYLTSWSKFKIIYFENIERMTISATNAILKLLEEPFKRLIIIASCQNKNNLLDTILSRGFIIKFHLPFQTESESYLNNLFPEIDKRIIQELLMFYGNKIGLVINYLNNNSDNKLSISDFLTNFQKFTDTSISLTDRYRNLLEISQNHNLDQYLESLIRYLDQNNKFNYINKVLEIKKMYKANVGIENLLFYLAINN